MVNLKDNKVVVIEGLCYLYPHKRELFANSPEMKGVWRNVQKFLKKEKNSFIAPLLVDDLKRTGHLCRQTFEEILEKTIAKKYDSLPWLGDAVMESEIESQYGNLGCKMFDSLYHRDILLSLMRFKNWKWIVVHPVSLQEQQSGMLLNLFNIINRRINFSLLARKFGCKTEEIRKRTREEFLDHFEHCWIDKNGDVVAATRPVYNDKKIIHYEY